MSHSNSSNEDRGLGMTKQLSIQWFRMNAMSMAHTPYCSPNFFSRS